MKVKSYSERKACPPKLHPRRERRWKFPGGRQDRQDVLDLVAAGKATPKAIRAILKKHRPDLLGELQAIISDGKPRTGPQKP